MLRRFLHIAFLRIAAIWHFLRRTDILTFLLFLLLSSLIWWGRTMSTPHDMKISIPLHYSSIPDDVLFEHPLPTSLLVEVRDKGRQLRHLPTSDTQLEIDVKSLISSQDGRLHISTETLRQRLEDILPGSTMVLSVQPEQIAISYQHQGYRTVPVQTCVHWTCAAQYQPAAEIIVEPKDIKVYGSRHQITAIKAIYTDSITITDVRDTVRSTIKLIAPEHVRLIPDQVQVTCISEQFTERSCTLPIEVKGKPENAVIHLFPSKVEVFAQVGMSHFTDVQDEDFVVYCLYPDSATSAIPVEVKCTNEYVGTIRTNPSLVEYIVEHIGL